MQRGVEASVVFRPHSRLYLQVYIASVKNADVVLSVLPLPEVFVPLSSLSSPSQLDLQIPPIIQPLLTTHTIFLLNKSYLLVYPPFHLFLYLHPNKLSHQIDEGYSTIHLKLIPTDTSV